MRAPLKAPFPYSGGKSRVADLVWSRLGDVDNYVEPFAGTLAVLLRRPADHFRDGYRVETVNDASHYLVNFWRAVQRDPEAVAAFADNPVFEADLHARHKWLVRSQEAAEWRERMRTDPDAFDAKIAGWWVWGQCCWIGGAWCVDEFAGRNMMPQITDARNIGTGVNQEQKPPEDSERRPSFSFNNLGPGVRRDHVNQEGRPQLTDAFDIGRGVNSGGSELHAKRPNFPEGGIGLGVLAESNQAPNLSGDNGSIGRGVAAGAGGESEKMPRLTGGRRGDEYYPGIGVNNSETPDRRPVFNNGLGYGVNSGTSINGTCEKRRAWLIAWMQRLADRLRLVRTCYGHWSRVCDSDSTMTRLGLTGVFLDPPYPANRGDNGKKSRDPSLYVNDKHQCLDALRDEVLAWCKKWSGPQVRIAVCGYEGDGYEALVADGWDEVAWEASGGYANQRRKGKGKSANAKRERIWFSPACLKPGDGADLFSECEAPQGGSG